MRTSTTAAVTCLAALLAGCGGGGPARFKLKEMAASDGERIMMTYNDKQIASVKVIDRDGSVDADVTFQYANDRISTVTTQPPGGTASVSTFSYTDGRLSGITTTAGSYSSSTSYTYGDDGVSHMQGTSSYEEGFQASVSNDFTYTDGRLTRVTSTESWTVAGLTTNQTWVMDLTYDDDGRLTTLSRTVGTDIDIESFSYDKDGRLSRVVSGSTTFSLEYTDGKVSRTIGQGGGKSEIVTYTYEDGEVLDVVGNPQISGGSLFDLAGKLIPMDQVYITSSLLGAN